MENQNLFPSDKNWVKAYIVDVLPCISVAFFVLAYVYNAAFFSVFDIDLLQYATFGDIFISITEPLCIFAFFALIFSSFYQRIQQAYLHLFQINSAVINNKPSSSRWPTFAKIKKSRFIKWYNSLNDNFVSSVFSMFASMINLISKIIPNVILLVFLFLYLAALCADWIFSLLRKCDITPSLSVAALVLIIPFYFIPAVIGVWKGILEGSNEFLKKLALKLLNLTKSKIKTVFVIFTFSYYLYAIFIFAAIGLEQGNGIKENNNTAFTIKTSDGTIFDNKSYGYITHISEKTFLFNKKNFETVVLCNENITYTQIKNVLDNKVIYKKIVSDLNRINSSKKKEIKYQGL